MKSGREGQGSVSVPVCLNKVQSRGTIFGRGLRITGTVNHGVSRK